MMHPSTLIVLLLLLIYVTSGSGSAIDTPTADGGKSISTAKSSLEDEDHLLPLQDNKDMRYDDDDGFTVFDDFLEWKIRNDFNDMTSRYIFQNEPIGSLLYHHQYIANTTSDNLNERTHHCSLIGRAANCHDKHLHVVPDDLPQDINVLDLNYNMITDLPNRVFTRYPQLVKLDLSYNQIQRLNPLSFYGLSCLQMLSLRNNNILYLPENFPNDVFTPLINLTKLVLSLNNPDPRNKSLTYPHTALGKLSKVVTLQLDGIHDPVFGYGFRNMTALRRLSCSGFISGYCYIGRLRRDAFQNVNMLTHLRLQACSIIGRYVDPEAFSPLENLQKLNLEHNEDIDLKYLDTIFKGLRSATNLTHLNLHLVNNRYSLGVCLDSFVIRNIPKSVKFLSVQENSLQAVDRHVIESLPPGIQTLDMSGNPFVFGTYVQDVHKMKSLTTFILNGQSYVYQIPKIYPYTQPNDSAIDGGIDSKCSLYNLLNDDFSKSPKFILKFPPNLKTIKMVNAGLTYILSEWTVDPDNVVENIYIGNNTFPQLFGPIRGFKRLQNLDISHSSVEMIYQTFFDSFTSLHRLDLKGNILGQYLRFKKEPLFSKLKNLKMLNLGQNLIEYLHSDAFIGLNNLVSLYLDHNPLYTFYVNISHMNSLQKLHLGKTLISTLPELTRHQIDLLIHTQPIRIGVNMSQSPISCICQNLPFLRWMSKSPAFWGGFKGYTCTYADSSVQSLQNGYNKTIENLSGECTDHSLEFFIVAGVSVLFLIILVGLICYQFRWTLRYLYYVAYLHFKTSSDSRHNDNFEFDTFICYAGEDDWFILEKVEPELVSRGMRVLIHERDFSAGEYIASNIVRAIRESKKTLVILTKAMLKSKWCNYEIQMANVEARRTGRPVLIFMIKETNPMTVENLDVFYNIQVNSYCEYPPQESDKSRVKVFWDKLCRDIKT